MPTPYLRHIFQPNTPRKKALKRVINRQRVTITRLRKKFKGQKPSTSCRQRFAHKSVPANTPLQKFIKSQSQLANRNKFGRRYTVNASEVDFARPHSENRTTSTTTSTDLTTQLDYVVLSTSTFQHTT